MEGAFEETKPYERAELGRLFVGYGGERTATGASAARLTAHRVDARANCDWLAAGRRFCADRVATALIPNF
jgi:hypothetical protein